MKRQKRPLRSYRSVRILAFILILMIAFIVAGVLKVKQDAKKKSHSDVAAASSTSEKIEKTTTTVSTTNDPNKFVEATTIEINEDKWNLTLLNRNYKLPDDYVPRTAKITLSQNDPRRSQRALSQTLDYRVAKEYQKMYDAAVKDGIYLTPYSGYRSIEHQNRNFENFVGMYKEQGCSTEEAKYKTSTVILPPGTSEHNMGLAMDIINTKDAFVKSKEYAWLVKHAQDYGFILRYTKDKKDITKIVDEPWHWRYVGVKAAKEMKQNGQCLEEYLNN